MKIVTLDAETYFDKDYTLSKMTTESYVRDPRFEILGCAVRYADGDKEWLSSDADLKPIIDAHDAVLCHHAQFDGFILAHHYGARPRVWLDTLSMARLCLGNHLSVGLDHLAKHFGLGAKTVPYAAFKGKHWHELDPATQHAVVTGSLHDVDLTWHIFNLLLPAVPDEELRLIDMTIRMFTEPVLMGDVELLGKVWSAEDTRKQELLDALGVVAGELQSAEKFATLLRLEGIEPPMKETPAGKAYAFARTDKFMTEELLEHTDDRIRTLAEARLGVRSTIEQTRAERLGRMALRGPLPVYLAYCGAHTTRWSGGDKVNWQNFKRGSLIRTSIRAPARHRIIKADKSQVECRYLNMLAGQSDVIERFRNKQDPYITIASEAYGHPVYKPKEDDPRRAEMEQKRGTGKQLELSCGYGAGGETIQATAAKGTYGPPVKITIERALAWRDLYRKTHPRVVQFWHAAGQLLERVAAKQSGSWSIFNYEDGRIYLPNGAPLIYDGLEWATDPETGSGFWRYRSRFGWRRIWGGFLVENLIQAVSRVDIGQCMLRLQDRGYHIALMEHDAVAVVVKEENAEHDLQVVLTEMRRAPDWLPDIPLDAEGSVKETYS